MKRKELPEPHLGKAMKVFWDRIKEDNPDKPYHELAEIYRKAWPAYMEEELTDLEKTMMGIK